MRNVFKRKSFNLIATALIILFITNFSVFPILFDSTIVGIYKDYYAKWIVRKPHITGQIKLGVQGKSVSLSDKNTRLTYRSDSNEQNIKLINGRFNKDYGDYGNNIFRLY